MGLHTHRLLMQATTALDDEASLPTVSGDVNPFAVVGGTVVILVLCILGYHLHETDIGPRGSRGKNWKWHALYWGIAVPIIILVPPRWSRYVFSDLTQTVVGVAVPIYESLRAVCTPPEDDDKLWLQYWMLGGLIFIGTTWVDDVIRSDVTTEYWYETMIFLFYWLYFPKTQGATLVYERITKPYLTPFFNMAFGKLNNFITYMYQLLINAAHLWFLWLIFMFLPAGLKRMVAIVVGTLYPLVASVSAAATPEIDDDTYWLTYWSVYGVLFMIMDIL